MIKYILLQQLCLVNFEFLWLAKVIQRIAGWLSSILTHDGHRAVWPEQAVVPGRICRAPGTPLRHRRTHRKSEHTLDNPSNKQQTRHTGECMSMTKSQCAGCNTLPNHYIIFVLSPFPGCYNYTSDLPCYRYIDYWKWTLRTRRRGKQR